MDVFAVLFILADVVAVLGSQDRFGALMLALTVGILVGYMPVYGLF